jgi:formylglycine-generating enzyme required for sulfatase activity
MPWQDARAYCRYLGKDLPDSKQWEKALRGGLTLGSGARNPYPTRNFPWGAPRPGLIANLNDVQPKGPAPVGTFPGDVSPEGVLDLAGNVSEWTLAIPPGKNPAFRVIRGGNWEQTAHAGLLDYITIQNTRPRKAIWYSIGFRCASLPESSESPEPAPR